MKNNRKNIKLKKIRSKNAVRKVAIIVSQLIDASVQVLEEIEYIEALNELLFPKPVTVYGKCIDKEKNMYSCRKERTEEFNDEIKCLPSVIGKIPD